MEPRNSDIAEAFGDAIAMNSIIAENSAVACLRSP
jgi:hypothetical protein